MHCKPKKTGVYGHILGSGVSTYPLIGLKCPLLGGAHPQSRVLGGSLVYYLVAKLHLNRFPMLLEGILHKTKFQKRPQQVMQDFHRQWHELIIIVQSPRPKTVRAALHFYVNRSTGAAKNQIPS